MTALHPRRLAMAVAVAFALGMTAAVPAGAGVPSPAPGAVDDAYSVDEDTTLQVDAPGVLQNDQPGATTCVSSVEDADVAGELDVLPTGAFTYVPPADFHGEVSFTYGIQADGGADCPGPSDSDATVRITVNPLNDAPMARSDTFQALPDRTLNIAGPGVLANDTDVEGDPLVAEKVSNPAHGEVTLAADGGFSYTPVAGYLGPDGFSYRASDGTATSPVRIVSITVTGLPTPPPTVAPTPTPAPEATPTLEPSPSASADPSPSPDPLASPSTEPSVGASPTPGSSAPPGPVADAGGLSIPVLVIGLVLLSLAAFGGAVYVPKWLERRRAGEEPPLD